MRFTVERDALAEAVTWAARALPARPVLPVLSGLLLSATQTEGATRTEGAARTEGATQTEEAPQTEGPTQAEDAEQAGDDAAGLTLSCFDYEVSARGRVRAEVTEPGPALVPGRLLVE